MSLAIRLQSASSDFQKLQASMAETVDVRQKLEAQLSENELVKKELANVTPENIVYKQIGSVLVKQDLTDAKSTVETRLEFIKSEIKRIEVQLKEIEGKQEKKKQEVS
ncbi:hypothetical protein AGABI1DRAFT_31425 [Agaricus bisporus var. burnettii JB137-S8]|uniref:Prefoldin subunit 6 n=1 Tax=Agaricus bisporus var. burnettii (strain JB137-S8 / ATCC MYA-4627 / FGSC 10392) TaxID=597362 RepID=K5Y644_AGABU|nr:uncharacterized protein AGABI1DRAFT_31425 [Agaricus bisporus var. burnettii JB137-S8]EKM83585.1 hypothetical protein AGABI1DRAFT_31425 [Agaricus bisporus var. burnettii JB137-S8]